MSIYVPYDANGAYPWNVGLAASGNHILPYGLSLASKPLSLEVGQSADLFDGGVCEVPEGCELSYSYAATPVSVDTGRVTGKKTGTSEVTTVLSLGSIELVRAIRSVEVIEPSIVLTAEQSAATVQPKLTPRDSGYTSYAYIVTFDPDGGSPIPPTQSFSAYTDVIGGTLRLAIAGVGSLVQPNPQPTKTGYELKDWWQTSNPSGAAWDFSKLTNNSIYSPSSGQPRYDYAFTLTARWTPITYDIKYELNNGSWGSVVAPSTYTIESANIALPEPTRQGYNFQGWYSDKNLTDASKVSSIATGSSGDKMFYAKWAANKYTVIFDSNKSNGSMTPQEFTYEDFSQLKPNEFWRSGYYFDSWNTRSDGTGNKYTDKQAVKNLTAKQNGTVTLYAQWKPILYTVQYNLNGGTGTVPATQSNLKHETYVQMPTESGFGKEGYRLTAWTTEQGGSGKSYGPGSMQYGLSETNGDVVTLYAQWTLKQYTVSFDSNGGNEGVQTKTVNHGASIASAPTASRAGYDFAGWWTEKEGGIQWNSSTTFTSGATYYAHWTPQKRTVTFNANDGVGSMSSQTFTYGETAKPLSTNGFNKTGYTFTGWNAEADGNGKAYTTDKSYSYADFADNATLYAQWQINQYSVTFKYNDNTTADTVKTINHGSTVTAPADPQRTGYGFAGWFTEAEGGSKVTFPITVTGQLTYHAHWTLNTYTVTFDHNDGTGTKDTATVGHGLTITEPLQPKRTGYEFAGWHTKKDVYSPWDFSTGVTGKTDLYAHWTLKQFAYTLGTAKGIDAGPSATPSGTYDYNSTITLDAVVKTGYEFKGWKSSDASLVADQAKANTTFAMPAGALTMTPTAAPISYSITFNLNDGNPLVNPPSGYNIESQPITLPTPTRANHTFAGWYDNRDFNNASITTLPTGSYGDKTFWAKWVIDKRTVTFDTKGGSTIEPVQVDHGSTVAAPTPEPTKDGFVFGGWYSDEKCTNEYDFSAQVTGDITLHAKWVDAMPLVFTLNPDGASLSVSVNPVVKNTITSVNIPSVYEFEGRKLPVTEILRAVPAQGILGGFQGCTKLERVLLPDGLLVVGDAAFADCPLLSSADLPGSLVEVANGAFKGCTSLPSVEVPGNVTKIGSEAFSGCSILESVSLPNGLTDLGSRAFEHCARLTEVAIPSGVTAIGDGVFAGSGLTTVSLPSTLASIGASAFSGCATLNHVALPESLAALGESAFASSGLTSIDLPASLTSIGANAFASCNSLASVFAHGSMAESGAANAFDAATKQRAKVLLPLTSANGTETFDQMAAAWGTEAGGHGFANVHATGGDLPMVDNIGAVNWSFEVTDPTTGLGTLTIEQTASGTIDYLADWATLWNKVPTEGYWAPLRDLVRKVVMKSSDGTKLSAKDTSNWFNSFKNLEDYSQAYVPDGVENTNFMFDTCRKLTSLPDSFTLPDSVKSSVGMFRAAALQTYPQGLLRLPEGIESTNSMFSGCRFSSLPDGYTLERNTSLKDTGWMFSNTPLTSLPSSFRFPESIVRVESMFLRCESLVSLPQGFVIPRVSGTVMDGDGTSVAASIANMFSACPSLTYLPASLDLAGLKDVNGFGDLFSWHFNTPEPEQPIQTLYEGSLPDGFNVDLWPHRHIVVSSAEMPAGSTLVSFMLPDAAGSYASEPWSRVMTDASGMLVELVPELREGLAFAGWYVDAACTQAFDFTKSVTAQGGVAANPVDKLYGRYVQASGDLPTTDGAQNAHWELDRSGTLKIWCEPGCTIGSLGWDMSMDWEHYWGPVRSQVKRVQMDPSVKAETVANWFASMDKLVDATGIFVPEGAASTRGMFNECSSLAKLPDGFSIPEGVTDAVGTIRLCPQLTALPDGFRLPDSVQEVSGMFEGSGIVSLPAGFTITNNVVNTNWMFQSCRNLVELPEGFSLPDSGNLVSVKSMFNMAFALRSLPEGFTVPQSVSNCDYLFGRCESLTSLPQGFSLPVRADFSAKQMFQACNTLTVLPASLSFKELLATGWDMSANAKEMMIYTRGTPDLPTIYMGLAENIPDATWWSSMHRALYTPNDPSGSPLPEGTHLVKFVVQGASASPWDDYVTMPTDANGAVSAPGNPSRFGYPFQGWYADPELTVKFDFDTAKIETDDVVVYGKFGPPILRFEAPLSAGVSLDESRTVTTAQVEARSYTPVPVRVESLRCEQGPNAPDVFAEPSKVSATVRLGDAATAVKLPLTGTPASASASLASSTGFSHPSSLSAEVGLDLGGSVVRQTPDGAVDVAHIVWSVGL